QLDPRHDLDPAAGCVACSRDAGQGVVVGEGEDGDATRHRGLHDVGRVEETVGRGGVAVEVDGSGDGPAIDARVPRHRHSPTVPSPAWRIASAWRCSTAVVRPNTTCRASPRWP